jgi:hypothetical protein
MGWISAHRVVNELTLSVKKKELIEAEIAVIEEKRKSLRSRPASVPSSSSISPQANSEESPPTRRSTRIRQPQPGKYAESSDSEAEVKPDAPAMPTREASRRTGLERELGILRTTAGIHTPDLTSSPKPCDESSDDDKPLINKKGKGKAKEVIQGMCEVVEVRIDNLRPTENQVTERDFLDAEPSGDEDWDGDDDDIGGGYAW